MTIDERLEKLAERTEALTQSVELIAKMQQQTEKELKRLGRYIRAVARLVLDHEARLRSLEGEDENGEEQS